VLLFLCPLQRAVMRLEAEPLKLNSLFARFVIQVRPRRWLVIRRAELCSHS